MPSASTVKGQHCNENTEYFGNPCKAIKCANERVAILFAGQGSQYPGMLDSYMNNSASRELLRIACEKLEMDIEEICSISADAKTIQDTQIAQPIVFVADLMAAEMMRQKVPVDFSKVIATAGYSLGELVCLCFAGAISYVDALSLVKIRSEAMALCTGGSMCNIRGVSRKEAKKLAKKFDCTVSNIVCDHDDNIQKNVYIVAGSSRSIDSLLSHVSNVSDTESGGKGLRATKLRVSGAFHSKMMAAAKETFQNALKSIKIILPKDVLVYSNISGRPYASAEEIRKMLPLQITSPVQWHKTISDMSRNEGIKKFIECGPQNSLSKMLPLILPAISNEQIITSDDDDYHV